MEKKREKRTSRKGDRIVSVCMVLVFFVYLFLGIQVNVDAGEQKTVKIGYYEAHDFQEGADDSAAKSGYSYEYIQKVASYTGWRYQYVYGEWKELYEKLKTGEIDLMAGISYDDDRVNSMLFPKYEMINETFYIYKDTDDTTIKCGNIDSYAGKKIGVVNNDKRMMTALAEHDTVTVGYSNDYLPYCDTDKDGKATGLVSDLIPDMFDALPGDYEPDIIYRGYNSQNEMA